MQYILKTMFKNTSGIYTINDKYESDETYRFTVNNVSTNLYDRQLNDCFDSIYLNNSTEVNLVYDERIAELSYIYKIEEYSDQGKCSIVQMEFNKTVNQFGDIYFKYTKIGNKLGTKYGKYSIIIDNKQYNTITIDNKIITEFELIYNNYDGDNQALKDTKIITSIKYSSHNLYNKYFSGSSNFDIFKHYFALDGIIEYYIVKDDEIVDYINDSKSINKFIYSSPWISAEHYIRKQVITNNFKLNYLNQNQDVTLSTAIAYTYRKKYKNGTITFAEASSKATLKSLQYAGVDDKLNEFILKTIELNVPSASTNVTSE